MNRQQAIEARANDPACYTCSERGGFGCWGRTVCSRCTSVVMSRVHTVLCPSPESVSSGVLCKYRRILEYLKYA